MNSILLEENEEFFVVGNFTYKDCDYKIVDVGIKSDGFLCFPTTYVVNLTNSESQFITNEMKFGVQAFDVDQVNGEIHIFGCFCGQCDQWNRFSIKGGFLGYINNDGTYEDVDF